MKGICTWEERAMLARYVKIRGRVQQAFRVLRKLGYRCRSNFSCCMSCGLAELEAGGVTDKWVFWHRQDTDSAARTGELHLRWGGDGHLICDELRKAGLRVVWPEEPDRTIVVTGGEHDD